jgi:hypothetical protein
VIRSVVVVYTHRHTHSGSRSTVWSCGASDIYAATL